MRRFVPGDSCPYHLVTERQRWARGFVRLCDSIPKGNSRYLNIYPPHRPSENLDFLLFITVLRAYKAL